MHMGSLGETWSVWITQRDSGELIWPCSKQLNSKAGSDNCQNPANPANSSLSESKLTRYAYNKDLFYLTFLSALNWVQFLALYTEGELGDCHFHITVHLEACKESH